jgi:hypothetical protein
VFALPPTVWFRLNSYFPIFIAATAEAAESLSATLATMQIRIIDRFGFLSV